MSGRTKFVDALMADLVESEGCRCVVTDDDSNLLTATLVSPDRACATN